VATRRGGFQDSGVNVLDLGQISTDMLYFAVVHHQTDGGIVISASHNPAAYNGMKLVRRSANPLSADTGLFKVRDIIQSSIAFGQRKGNSRGTLRSLPFLNAYLAHLCSFVDAQRFS